MTAVQTRSLISNLSVTVMGKTGLPWGKLNQIWFCNFNSPIKSNLNQQETNTRIKITPFCSSPPFPA